MRMLLTRGIVTTLVLAGSLGVLAESVARRTFVVHVPPRVSIQSPANAPIMILPPSQARVEFAQQDWEMATNSHSGATIQFVTEHSFHNQTDVRRDAQLELKLLSQSKYGTWKVVRPSDATNHEIGREAATVQVSSISPGSAVVGLTVTFLPGSALSTPSGDYETTVVGTITAN